MEKFCGKVRFAKKAATQQKEIDRLRGVVDRFGTQVTKVAIAHSIQKRIARIEQTKIEVSEGNRVLKVKFLDPPHCGMTLIEAKGLSKKFCGSAIFDKVDFDLGKSGRLLVLGLNGAGKTTNL